MPDAFCGACGRRGRADDRFCRGCGAPLTDDTAADEPIAEAERLAAIGRSDEATALLRDALRSRESGELRVALATLCLRRGDVAAAEQELERAISVDPGCAVAHAYAGALLVRRGRVEEAAAALDHALSLAPDDLVVRIKRAEYWLALGILGRARDELRQGLTDGGGTPETRAAAARMLRDAERRLGHAVTRRTVALPDAGAFVRLVRRWRDARSVPAAHVTRELEV